MLSNNCSAQLEDCLFYTSNRTRPAALLAPLSPAQRLYITSCYDGIKHRGQMEARPRGRNMIKKRYTDGAYWGDEHLFGQTTGVTGVFQEF